MLFFRYLWNFVRSWFGVSTLNRSMSSLQTRIDVLKKEKDASDRRLVQAREELLGVQEYFTGQLQKTLRLVDDAQITNNKLEQTLETTRDALRAANEVVIPGLTAANELFIKRWEAETAVQAMRMVSVKDTSE